MNTLLDRVKSTIKKHQMLKPGEKVIAAVSGGADSICMLYLLNLLKKEMGFYLHVAHLNHMFRKKESQQDLEFVKEFSKDLNLPITTDQINVLQLVKRRKISQEEAAREARYQFLFDVAREIKAEKIAIGHTKDDQAETVLMRMFRGAGKLGLCGIAPVRRINDYIIIRPLIELWRKDIQTFLKKEKLPSRVDSTNTQITYFRNRIRHELLPLLEKDYNSNIKEILVNMAENLREEEVFLDKLAKRKYRSVLKSTSQKKEVAIELKKFLKFPPALQKKVIRVAIETLQGDLRRITYQHWKELDELILQRPGGSVVDLPKNLSALKKKDKIVFYLK